MSQLSVAQRSGIRAIADGNPDQVPTRTLNTLVRKGLVVDHPPRGVRLTSIGRAAHANIMASGDGPEALKELFRL